MKKIKYGYLVYIMEIPCFLKHSLVFLLYKVEKNIVIIILYGKVGGYGYFLQKFRVNEDIISLSQ